MFDCLFKVYEEELSYSDKDEDMYLFNENCSDKEYVWGGFRNIAALLIFHPVSDTVALASGVLHVCDQQRERWPAQTTITREDKAPLL